MPPVPRIADDLAAPRKSAETGPIPVMAPPSARMLGAVLWECILPAGTGCSSRSFLRCELGFRGWLAARPKPVKVLRRPRFPQNQDMKAVAPIATWRGPMPAGARDKFDFFLSRRGSITAVSREVTDVLTARGYVVFVQDYDIPLGASFVEAMHEAIQASRDLIILFTGDYETSSYTRKEFTSFEAQRLQDPQARRIVILRCEDVPLTG